MTFRLAMAVNQMLRPQSVAYSNVFASSSQDG